MFVLNIFVVSNANTTSCGLYLSRPKVSSTFVQYNFMTLSLIEYELNSTKTDIKNLKNDDSYNNNEELENLARNKLGMIKQNEIIYLEK